MNKFKNKYRIKSARLQNWDYKSQGLYYITICTKNRDHSFGEIKNNKMILSELGLIVNGEWEKTPEIRPDMNLELGEFTTMPNHFHGIIGIGKNKFNSVANSHGNDRFNSRDAMHCVSTIEPIISVDVTDNKNKFGPQSKNISSIIRGFKSSVTKYARVNGIEFKWQARFHDHIVRDEEELIKISNYIKYNVKNWKEDDFYEGKD